MLAGSLLFISKIEVVKIGHGNQPSLFGASVSFHTAAAGTGTTVWRGRFATDSDEYTFSPADCDASAILSNAKSIGDCSKNLAGGRSCMNAASEGWSCTGEKYLCRCLVLLWVYFY